MENPAKFSLKFNQIYLSKPTHWEKDGAPMPMMPNEARLRNLTYASPLYVDITKVVTRDESVNEKSTKKYSSEKFQLCSDPVIACYQHDRS
ncbi:hypothetical protein B9Z55_010197 [Caenorhabditis nigoni]|uniref:DNA-directed RNA polymerase n=1 Tax=Caenorhabditis nigoni TaxID=1611254 RepID=A0A2G5UFD8_9PELO|nr:hypothetical protein B9Z55_010197 [Caenorhabditis nigoni]